MLAPSDGAATRRRSSWAICFTTRCVPCRRADRGRHRLRRRHGLRNGGRAPAVLGFHVLSWFRSSPALFGALEPRHHYENHRHDNGHRACRRTGGGRRAGADFVTVQPPGQWLASQFLGKPVTNQAGETIGNINGLLSDKSGRIATAVIGVGGSWVSVTRTSPFPMARYRLRPMPAASASSVFRCPRTSCRRRPNSNRPRNRLHAFQRAGRRDGTQGNRSGTGTERQSR